MIALRKAAGWLALLANVALGGCGSSDNSALGVVVVGDAGDPFTTGARRPLAGQLVQAATMQGLVAFDEQGRVIPGLADRWIVTDDGQSYIFRLRDGNWLNGDPITAASVKRALESALDAVEGTPLALDLAGIQEIRAMAGRVIEIRLGRPMPYLLHLLAEPELGLVHQKEGAGPMSLVAGKNGVARLTPIEPSVLGLPRAEDWASRTRRINLLARSGPEAVAAFNDGRVDLVLGGQIQDFPLTRSVGILRGTIQLDAVTGLFGLRVMNGKGFLAEPANREALAMAIDRAALIDPFRVGGWSSTNRLVSPGVEGDLQSQGERWSGQTIEQRRDVAARRLRGWSATNGPVRLTVWLPAGEGSDILFQRLSSDFALIGGGLGRARNAQDADLALVDEVARYPRAAWFFNRLSCAKDSGLCSEKADASVAEAGTAQNPEERAALLGRAEAELTAANVFIPFGVPIRWSLARGSVRGFSPNSWGWHPLMPLAWMPK